MTPEALAEREAKTFAVAVTLTKVNTVGSINIITNLNLYEASSEDEARGKALMAATSANPEHSYSHMAIVAVRDHLRTKEQEHG